MRNQSYLILSLTAGLLGLSAVPTSAQTTGSSDSILNFLTPQTKLGANLTQGIEYDFPSSVDNPGSGDLAIFRANTAITYSENRNFGFFRIGGSYEFSNYDWGNTSYFRDVNSLGLNGFGMYKFQEDEPWGIFGVTSLELAAENGASFSNGLSYLVGIGPSYTVSRDLRFGLGVGMIGSPQQAIRYIPMPTLDWTINEHWNIRTFNGATITYDLHGDKRTRFDFSAQYDSSSFAIDAPAPAGRSGNPVVEEQSVVLIGGVTQELFDPLFIRFYLQGTVYREYEFRTDRNRYLTLKTDPSFAVGFQIGASF